MESNHVIEILSSDSDDSTSSVDVKRIVICSRGIQRSL